MGIRFRNYKDCDLECMTSMWNEILEDGMSFPGTELYESSQFQKMLDEQTRVVCMEKDGELVGYYILHPNNIGRCSHIANASYVIKKTMRGKHLGKFLVQNSIEEAERLTFRGLQFNAVVSINKSALIIYEQIGFQKIGIIPGGFLLPDGSYSDMYILFMSLTGGKN